jgi:hypothetical protein
VPAAAWLALVCALQGASLLGRWEYVAPPRAGPPTRRAGLLVTLELNSAAGTDFSGRVARWFAGDVGVSPAAFGAVSGRIDGATVTLAIPFASAAAPQVDVRARLIAADTLQIASSRRGNEPGPFAAGARFVRTRRGAARARP